MTVAPTSFLSGTRKRLRGAAELWTFYALTVLLAYGFTMFNLVLAGDDWDTLQANYQTDFNIAEGRWFDPIIRHLANNDNVAAPFTLGVLAIAYGVFAAACCVCLGLKRRESYLIFACVLVCFPFNAEPFVFKNMHLVFAFAMVLATISGLLIVRSYELLIGGQALKSGGLAAGAVTAFILSAAAYQTHALLAAALVLARSAGMLREPQGRSELLRSIALLLGLSAVIFGVGCLLYMESTQAASWLTGISLRTHGRYAIGDPFVKNWHELFSQVYHGLGFLAGTLFRTQHLFPLVTKLAFLLMTTALVGVMAFGSDKPRDPGQWRVTAAPNGIAKAAILLGVLALLFLAPLALGMLLRISQYRYNNLIGVAVPYAMVFALLFDTVRDQRWRNGVAAVTLAIAAIFIFEQNRASITTFLLNRRDLAVASQMIERITANPAFAPFAAKRQATILLYGYRLEPRTLPRPFSVDGLKPRSINDCGVFNCQWWRIAPALRLISAGSVTYRTDVWPALTSDIPRDEKAFLEQRIKEAHPWPAPDAVIFGTDVIVIMLKPAENP